MCKKYIVTFSDGFGEEYSLKLSRQDTKIMVQGAIWNAVVASSAIEDVDISDTTPPDPSNLPDSVIPTN